MEEKKVWFESATAGVLRVDGVFLGVTERKPLRAEIAAERAVLEFNPLDTERYLPFCCRVGFRPECGAPRAKLISWGNGVYSVRLDPEGRKRCRPLTALAQAEYGDGVYTVCDDGSAYLLAESESGSVILPIDADLTSAELSVLDTPANLLELRAAAGRKTYYGLYRLDADCAPAFEGEGDRFTLSGDALTMEKTCGDMAGSRMAAEFAFDGETMAYTERRTLSYMRGFEKKLPERLIPYAFLEGVLEGGDTAALFLSSELADSFSPEAAAGFFGDFTEIAARPEETEPFAVSLLYPAECGCLTVKRYAFELEGRLIVNIKRV